MNTNILSNGELNLLVKMIKEDNITFAALIDYMISYCENVSKEAQEHDDKSFRAGLIAGFEVYSQLMERHLANFRQEMTLKESV